MAFKINIIAFLIVLSSLGCTKKEYRTEVVLDKYKTAKDTLSPNLKFITVRLWQYSSRDLKGIRWDENDNADVFFVLKRNDTILATSPVIYNLPTDNEGYAVLTGAWRFTKAIDCFKYRNDINVYSIYFYDLDDTGRQFMFKYGFRINNLNSLTSTSTIAGSGYASDQGDFEGINDIGIDYVLGF